MKKQRGVYGKLNLLFKKIDLFEPVKKDKRLNIQTNLKEIGFKETLNDDDFKYETELWFYGEL